MDNALNLKQRKTKNMINQLSTQLFTSQNISCKTADKINSYKARTYCDSNGHAVKVLIGAKEIYHTKHTCKHPLNPPIEDKTFGRIILNMYHEKAHCNQKNKLFRKSILSEAEQAQLLQEIACMADSEYYNGHTNYKINANEIQAEQYGIQKAYKYLCQNFSDVPKECHEQLLVDIINEKALGPDIIYFVKPDKPFESLSEIYQAFDKAYDDSFDQRREYYIYRNIEHNEIKQFADKHPAIKNDFIYAKTPLDQDKCIVMIYLQLHPELLDFYPALKNIDFSHETLQTHPDKLRKQQQRNNDLDIWINDIKNPTNDIDHESFL